MGLLTKSAGYANSLDHPLTITTCNSPPTISIVVACLNVAHVLPRCLESIAVQDYRHLEIIVADGGSDDGTTEILRNYSQRIGAALQWTSEPDSGVGDAWNRALRQVTGDWVLFLGADDRLTGPRVLSVTALALVSTDRRIVYGEVQLSNRDGETVGIIAEEWSPRQFRRCQRSLPHQAVFHQRSLFTEHGQFDTSLRFVSDYDFLLRELMWAEPLYLPGLIIANMQIGGISGTRKNAHRLVLEYMRLFRRHVGGIPLKLSWWLVKALGIAGLFALGGDKLALQATNVYRHWIGRRAPLNH